MILITEIEGEIKLSFQLSEASSHLLSLSAGGNFMFKSVTCHQMKILRHHMYMLKGGTRLHREQI